MQIKNQKSFNNKDTNGATHAVKNFNYAYMLVYGSVVFLSI